MDDGAAMTTGEPIAPMKRSSARRKATTVALVGLLGVGAVAAWTTFAERAAEGRFCTAAGAQGPLGETPEDAFAAWWQGLDATQLPRRFGPDPAHLPEVPTADDFVRDGRNYRWYASDDVWYQVDIDHPKEAGRVTSRAWQVIGANRCERAEASDFKPVS